ncbi:MAG: hypothetical protein EZS28_048996, partial [Streblomastix strix]
VGVVSGSFYASKS